MHGLMWRAAVAAGAAVVLLGPVAGAGASVNTASASPPVPGWSVTATPNPEIPTGQLFWVSCPASDSCMAVGVHIKASGQGASLAEQWNGSSWRIVRTPNPPGSTFAALAGVACSSPVACTAVGTSTIGGAAQALVERWNGAAWHLQKTPTPAQGGASLNAVSCASPSACTATGGFNGGALAEAWNGARWTIQATPNPPQGGGGLNGVSCTSASACIAVGNSNAGTLAERWNGTRWRIQPTPTPAGAQFAFLNTVACTSPSACTAAGAYVTSSGVFQTLAEHWDGTAWHRQATPNQGPSLLIGLACTSGAACTVVGFTNANQSPAVLVERSAGTTWRTQAAPNPAGAASSHLNGVACTSHSTCT